MIKEKTIEKVKVALTNLNAVLKECVENNISLQIEVNYNNPKRKSMLYCHRDSGVTFKLHQSN